MEELPLTWIFAPKNLQVLPLERAACRRIGQMIISAWSGSVSANAKLSVRSFCSQLPLTVRVTLLDTTLHMIEDHNHACPAALFAAEVLFSKGFKDLSLTLSQSFESKLLYSLLRILSTQSQQLTTLSLDLLNPRFKLADTRLFEKIFASANLVKLFLTSICNNEIMKLIGEHCTRLQALDVSNSHVTNKGLYLLTQNVYRVPSRTSIVEVDLGNSIMAVPNVLPSLDELIPSGGPVGLYERRKSPLCETLKVLLLTASMKITPRGLANVLGLASNLRSLELTDLEPFFTQYKQNWNESRMESKGFSLPSLNLTTVFVQSMTDDILTSMQAMCPRITRLIYNQYKGDTFSLPLSKLNVFGSLRSLTINNSLSSYAEEDLWTLSEETRSRMVELCLGNQHRDFNLCSILHAFPNIRQSFLFGTNFYWLAPAVPMSLQLESLSVMSLCEQVTGDAVINLIRFAPNLEQFFAYDISPRPKGFLEKLCDVTTSPNLKVFTLVEAVFLHSEDELSYFLQFFKKITHVGKLAFKTTKFLGENMDDITIQVKSLD